MSEAKEVAIFGAGCFWGVEERFRTTEGVISTEVGYCGGELPQPTYKEVCSGTTNHAEVVKVEFDSSKVSFAQLCDLFFKVHNPTTLNRQGPDIGTQYRSVIFYTSQEQRDYSIKLIKELNESSQFKDPVITQVVEVFNYFPAEEYHQKYLLKKGVTSCGI